jgi:tetratricopeptide (TPR) repeat protein
MGTMLRRLGRESEAKEAFEQSLACAQRLDDRDQIARSHITLEMLNRDEGNLQAALEHVRMALNLLAGSKTAGLRALTLQHLGDDLHASGDVERGKKALEDSLALARQANSNQLIADDSYMLADIARVQQAFHRGEELLREAEDYYIAQHQNVNLWDAWVTESRLRIAEGHAAGTDKKIQQSVAGFQTVKDEARECGAYAALLESYLAQKKPNHASRALAASRMLCSGTGEYDSRMLYAIRAIEVKAAVGDAAQAQQQLQSIAQDLETNGWGVLAREARTACCYVRRR